MSALNRTAVRIRLIGLANDVDRVTAQLTAAFDVADVSRPHACRGGSGLVRVYLTVCRHAGRRLDGRTWDKYSAEQREPIVTSDNPNL